MTFPSEPLPPDPADNASADGVWSKQIAPKIVRFKDLARCGDEIWIEHQGMLYRLRETRQGKLILTK
ncbi:Hemin uptake protein hemP [Novipirellula galeiformis]|uniref:Hemin uptake protein hemP n=1 Tax=Novipirellula galeiformis TaxID=2528004 RepID=A0A5C6C3D7_9BACT|nr:hemin uptake protein HemP [Novipirellula galeiformis]TWU17369.1 Hemin uptake protein hemP [Novipirellula galeiformis]